MSVINLPKNNNLVVTTNNKSEAVVDIVGNVKNNSGIVLDSANLTLIDNFDSVHTLPGPGPTFVPIGYGLKNQKLTSNGDGTYKWV